MKRLLAAGILPVSILMLSIQTSWPERRDRHNSSSKTPVQITAPLQYMSSVSRKTHTDVGNFDISLPLPGTPGVECRSGGASGNHTLVVTFNNNVVSGTAAVTSGTGSVSGSPVFATNTMTVNLTGVANAQTVTATLSNVTDNMAQVLPTASLRASFLFGDTNGDGVVNSGDALQTRNRSGQTTNATNFRSDVNLDGLVNSGDTFILRSRSGTFVPAATGCTENFDGVIPPALPSCWGSSFWVTSNSGVPAPPADSPPNAVFVNDQNGISDKTLETCNISITSAAPWMSFRNNFDTEYDPPPNEVFRDGYVLEISSPNINGGAFTDVTDPAVGGGFISGGYTGTIDNTANNPLAGRGAWSGNSGGYINTVINLGPNLNGQTIRLRFRMGTDEGGAAPGVRIDTFTIMGSSNCP